MELEIICTEIMHLKITLKIPQFYTNYDKKCFEVGAAPNYERAPIHSFEGCQLST